MLMSKYGRFQARSRKLCTFKVDWHWRHGIYMCILKLILYTFRVQSLNA